MPSFGVQAYIQAECCIHNKFLQKGKEIKKKKQKDTSKDKKVREGKVRSSRLVDSSPVGFSSSICEDDTPKRMPLLWAGANHTYTL